MPRKRADGADYGGRTSSRKDSTLSAERCGDRRWRASWSKPYAGLVHPASTQSTRGAPCRAGDDPEDDEQRQHLTLLPMTANPTDGNTWSGSTEIYLQLRRVSGAHAAPPGPATSKERKNQPSNA